MSRVASSVVPGTNFSCLIRRGAFLQILLLVAALVAMPGPSSAELPKYLPDGCNTIIVVDFAEVHDNPCYQKLKTDLADFGRGESSFQELVGVAPSNLAHLIMAGDLIASGRDAQPIVIVKTRKPITAADLRAARRRRATRRTSPTTKSKSASRPFTSRPTTSLFQALLKRNCSTARRSP